MRWVSLGVILVGLFFGVPPASASETAPSAVPADELCAPQFQITHPAQCLDFGPGMYAAQLAQAVVPVTVPQLPTEPLTRYDPIVPFRYARVITPDAPLFASPADGLAGVSSETIGKGFIYVTLSDPIQEGDQTFYRIRSGAYIRAADVSAIKATDFQGLRLSGPPQYPFGWIVANKVRPSRLPGAQPPEEGPALYRRTVIQIFATQRVGEWDWYLVGPNQWVEQRAISRVTFNPPPEGALPSASGKWIQVDLYEQTMVAYEGTQPIYATLVSSGLPRWATEPGLFHVWARLRVDGMSGSYEPDGSDYYSLEAVPWVLYFDGPSALHGEYWHDRLGFKRSHGCVNLAPLDARWLYDWAEKGTPVWVYDPSGQTVAGSGGSAP
ncbi:MAG: L,D-transpeptidase [Anaerolineales bacterium]